MSRCLVGVSPSPRRSARQRTSSSGAGSCRSSTRRLTGALRFNEFAEAVSGISPRMLSERLRDLEAAGLMERTVIPSSPPSVEYRLTERGRAARADHRSDARLRPRARASGGLTGATGPAWPRLLRARQPRPARLRRDDPHQLPARAIRGPYLLAGGPCSAEGLRTRRSPIAPPNRDQRRGHGHPEMEGVHRGLFGGARTATAPGPPATREIGTDPAEAVGCGERGSFPEAARPTPLGRLHRATELKRPATSAPSPAVPSSPATRATALLTPEAMPACSLRCRRAPPPSAARRSWTSPSANQHGREHLCEVVDVVAHPLEQRASAADTSGPSP